MHHNWQQLQKVEAEMSSTGAWVFSARLHDANTATVVREANGEILTTDGPFAEAKQRVRPGVGAARSLTPAERRLLARYVEAWESGDLDAFVGLLAEDVVLRMPPMPEWFAGQPAVRGFFAWAWSPSGPGPFRLLQFQVPM
jgi:hypothetical protein